MTGTQERTALIHAGLKGAYRARCTEVGAFRRQRTAPKRTTPRGASPTTLSGRCKVILIDTSVWVDYLRQSEAELVTALESEQVLPPLIQHVYAARYKP